MNIGYWGDGAVTAREAQIAFVRQLASRLPDVQGRRVLDVGCGLGGPAAILALEYGARVDGVNIVEEQAELARSFMSVNGLDEQVRVHVANAMELPFDDESFDAVFSLEAAHCFVDKPRFLQEAGRVLRPEGRLVMADITATWDVPVLRWQPAIRLDLVTAGRWHLMMEDAGFDVIEHTLVGPAVYPGFRRWLSRTAAERRGAILADRLRDGAPAWRRRLSRAQAGILEVAFNRSVLPHASALRLREYGLFVAQRRSGVR